ncbi:hypothetical protein IGI04_005934, partial [Brassica rapa subsp. trilocularis]
SREWRRKPTSDAGQEVNSPNLIPQHHQSPINLAAVQRETREVERMQTREQILEDINQATQQYLNCPDPKEAAARRLRVIASEKRGQVDETVETMLAHIIPPDPQEQLVLQHSQTQQIRTRDQVLEDLQDVTLQYLSCADPCEAQARQRRVLQGDAHGHMEETATRILSSAPTLTVTESSPLVDTVEQRMMIPSPFKENLTKDCPQEERNEDETIQNEESDSNVHPRRRRREHTRTRSVNVSPNVLLGASLRKRNISSMAMSPARRNSTAKNKTQAQQKIETLQQELDKAMSNPRIERFLPGFADQIQCLQPSLRGVEDRYVWQPLPSAVCLPPTGVSKPIFPWVIWSIWKDRNLLIFGNKSLTPAEIASKSLNLAREWSNAQELLPTGQNSKMGQQETSVRNLPPSDPEIVVCKSDAAWDAERNRAGLAWVLRGRQESVVDQGSTIQYFVNSPLIAEALAVREGIFKAASQGISSLWVCSDNRTLIRAINNKNQRKELYKNRLRSDQTEEFSQTGSRAIGLFQKV